MTNTLPDLSTLRVAVIVTDGVEEPELTEPVQALKAAGAQVDIISPHPGNIQTLLWFEKSIRVPVDRTLDEVDAAEYDAVHLPGGPVNPDQLRMNPRVQSFLQEMDRAGKPIAAICHAPWELVSAGLVRGRTLTSFYTVQDDVRNAGGNWVDQEVVTDGNLVTSRQPDDIPAYIPAMLALFARTPAAQTR